jgi:hypothetical protein
MRELYRAPGLDPSGLPVWAREQVDRVLHLLPDGMSVRSARPNGNSSIHLTIADGEGETVGQLVIYPLGSTQGQLETALKLHLRQIAVKHEKGLVWVTLGKLLDPQLAGRSNGLVVRIEKADGYEVTTICRGTGRPYRYQFPEHQVATVRLSLDS